MSTNEAAERLRTVHGHRLVPQYPPVADASPSVREVLDEALAAAKAEGAREAVERIRAQLNKVPSVISEGGSMAEVGYEKWATDRILDEEEVDRILDEEMNK